ncbi:hypothetical protein Bca52824_059619 [Brassica carinata]|uniref:Uncharacterized protein n=1 Tax=Brassica carinata TaxID=52824 RepID=A0A8X7UFV4_BRACI|nr:hypothetical protein Bca52824_059619 [Brassica carinata]
MHPDMWEEWWRPAWVLDMQPDMWSTSSTGSDQSSSPILTEVQELPEAKGGSVRVQISLSRPVSFFMVKPRFCPSRDQISPVQSSHPLGFGQVLSDQPAASRLEHCELACVNSTWNLG